MNLKDKLNLICILGTFIGIVLSRVIDVHYGDNGKITIVGSIIVIIALSILYLIIKKNYLSAIIIFAILLPLIIGFIGMYLNSLYLVIGGIASIFIIAPIMIKLMPKYMNNKKQ